MRNSVDICKVIFKFLKVQKKADFPNSCCYGLIQDFACGEHVHLVGRQKQNCRGIYVYFYVLEKGLSPGLINIIFLSTKFFMLSLHPILERYNIKHQKKWKM